MIQILLSQPDSYRDVIEHLQSNGAHVTLIGPKKKTANIRKKKDILTSMLSPALLRARGAWKREDRVLVVGWQALPVLAMIKMGLLPRPKKLLLMACFIHGQRARRVVNRLWRYLRFPGLGFIAFSQGEVRNLIEEVEMPASSVHFHLWRQELDGQTAASAITDEGYIFSGGFSNRDYDLLLAAKQDIDTPLMIVASEQNQIDASASIGTTVHRDLPEAAFEVLLAKSRVVAMPLLSQGEACGQSVLLRVLRNGKPLIATRHEAIEAYLGPAYPGFVPHGDVDAMRSALIRALREPAFRASLSSDIVKAWQRLEKRNSPGEEIEQFLLS
jgi:glycosyltransferase involved in cell wall biosynthesis